MRLVERCRACKRWWQTARSSVYVHRTLKWFWIAAIPISFVWRNAVFWVVFMSHYAIIVGHWSSEEAALGAQQIEESDAL